VLEHFDTGNVSPVGPSFNPGWNASGPAGGYYIYEPHTLPSVFPLGPQDSFRNDFGFFNVGLILLNLPPLDFLARIAAYPVKRAFGRRDPVFYPEQGVPFRFVGVSSGASIQIFEDDFSALALNADQFDEFIFQLAFHILVNSDSTTVATGGTEFKDNSVEPFFQIAFYIGGRFTSENTIRNARPSFGATVDFNNIPSYTYSADINLWEYAGSIRYSLSSSRLQPFFKGGYLFDPYKLSTLGLDEFFLEIFQVHHRRFRKFYRDIHLLPFDFCLKRIEKGLKPACVENCMTTARYFGDLDDPDSEVSRLIRDIESFPIYPGVFPGTEVSRPETEPSVYYLAR